MSNGIYGRVVEVLEKYEGNYPPLPAFVCTMSSERSMRSEIASCITSRIDDGLHLIAVEE